MKKLKINPLLFYLITIIYLELLIKMVMCNHIFNIGILYLLIFTTPIILLLTLLTKSFSSKTNKVILYISTIILIIYFEIQYIFYNLFSVPFSFSTIGLANQALDFTNIIKDAIIAHLPVFLAFFLPLVILIILHKKIDTTKYLKETRLSIFLMFIISYLSTFIFLIPNKDDSSSAYKLYYNIDDQVSIINHFGILTYTKIDIKRQILGYNAEIILESPTKEDEKISTEIDYGQNITNIDFDVHSSKDKDITTLNEYFKNKEASNKTKYTGMFKGKNLIFILAEGFNEVAVDETRTPTLYKMVNGGFVFNNFYSPVFLSTTGGEFQAVTGLIPTQEILNTWKSKTPKISYAIGNSFKNENYRVQSYHNWTYKYYKRQKTMPTLGFDNYIGCGNGLEKKMSCKWLPSDIDLINTTVDNYLGQEGNFAIYYISVSGHSPYNSSDNIAKKYLTYLESTDYSESVKYYLAAQMELDKMLETLITKLEKYGELENTVIALVGDHYPYTLSIDEMNEMSSYEKDDTIEVNRSNFILWNSAMKEPIQVDKVGSQIDVLPTILNLFGIEYDSRLIVGQDILSDYEGLAIFSNRSWVTDYGFYDSQSKKFTLKAGKKLEDEKEYVKNINNRVANSFSISKLMISEDYYSYILDE